MRIALDIRYKTYSGGATYAREIARHLLAADRDNSYVLVKYPDQSLETEHAPDAVIDAPRWPDLPELVWTVAVLPFRLRQLNVDVYHALKMPSPYWNFAATVSTLHAPYDYYKGEYFLAPIMKAYWRLYGRPQMKMNTAVVAVSEFMKDYGVERVGLRPEIVHVIQNGSDEAFRPMLPAEFMPVLQKFGLAAGYVLCVGNVTVVKNHITVVRALAKIADQTLAQLVIAGATHHRHSCYAELQDEIRRLGLEDRVRFLGLVDRDDLPALLNGARVMAFPSLQEGCPVAMIECFKCGTPLIGSVVPPVAELGRGFAPLVDDPRDPRQLAAHLLEVLTSDRRHAELRRLALEAGSRYSWRKSALAHLEVYKTCFNIRHRIMPSGSSHRPIIEPIRSGSDSKLADSSTTEPSVLARDRSTS